MLAFTDNSHISPIADIPLGHGCQQLFDAYSQ